MLFRSGHGKRLGHSRQLLILGLPAACGPVRDGLPTHAASAGHFRHAQAKALQQHGEGFASSHLGKDATTSPVAAQECPTWALDKVGQLGFDLEHTSDGASTPIETPPPVPTLNRKSRAMSTFANGPSPVKAAPFIPESYARSEQIT